MSLDICYRFNDNDLDDSEGNYRLTPGSWPKVARLVCAGYCLIDGVPFGNRAWTDLARASYSTQDQEVLKRYTLEAINPLINSGEIRDAEVEIDLANVDGLAVKVSFFDVSASRRDEIVTVAPWAKV